MILLAGAVLQRVRRLCETTGNRKKTTKNSQNRRSRANLTSKLLRNRRSRANLTSKGCRNRRSSINLASNAAGPERQAAQAVKAGKARQASRLSKQDIVDYHKVLYDHGYAVPNWKQEWGGTDWTSIQHQIFDDVTAAYDCPRRLAFGVSMVGPVLQAFGSREQQEKYLPRIARLDDWWCQGFSEPGSGSDLASLKTSAVRDGDEYVINGQKTWTTYAQHADMMFLLTRTDNECKPQEGISFMLLDMNTPGVTVKPIILLAGYHEVNEVFLDDVRIPPEN